LSDPSGSAGGAVALPSFQPAVLVKPDLPATDYGAEPGFYGYPADPKEFFGGRVPGRGGDFTTMSVINKTVKMDSSNGHWTGLMKRLGVTWKPQGSPSDGYASKFATAVAGNQIADAMQIPPGSAPNLPELLDAKFQDLTEFLSGDAVKDYPALANMPTQSWKSTVYNNKIYAVPLQRSALMWVGTARMDLLKAKSLPTQPTSGDELLTMYRGLTDEKKNHYALAFPFWVLAYVGQMTGAPNVWAEEGGKFTRDYETDGYKQAVSLVASMWKEGLFHPDSFASSNSQGSDWYHNGVVNALVLQGAWAWHQAATQSVTPTADVNWFSPPTWDGSGAAKSYVGPGIYSITAVKKGSQDRVAEVLRIMDWMAAPFGTAESTFQSYGTEGVDYTVEKGVVVQTDKGKADGLFTNYIAFRPQVHTSAVKQSVTDEYNSEKVLLKDGVQQPMLGLYSATSQSKEALLNNNIQSIASDIIQGRKNLSAWDDAVKSWKSSGGDKMRSELEDSYQKINGR
jgi:putative aldouronate transport system substrate-binding protein